MIQRVKSVIRSDVFNHLTVYGNKSSFFSFKHINTLKSFKEFNQLFVQSFDCLRQQEFVSFEHI